jgi:putative nucleotidyltransferase with HDIG domain
MFVVSLAMILVLFGAGVVQNRAYNSKKHSAVFRGEALFPAELGDQSGVWAAAIARSSTWGKIFDFDGEGLTENNYQAYTYDFFVTNNTDDQISDFSFKLVFGRETYLASAWNGALEIHQNVKGGELVATIPDLRDYDPDDYPLEMYRVDGESFVTMKAGDYLVYHPSDSMNAMEIPIEPREASTPGIILYVEMGTDIHESSLELQYRFNRALSSEPFFWASMVGAAIWLIALIIVVITSLQIRRYTARHERDNEIINESIETFTGFIDAKDPNTNGHSKRVAKYTRLIAKELGYEGEDLDRIYYVALLHDCGKIGVPDSILRKPGRLTEEEFEVIKSHTVRGGEILSSFRSLENVGEGARYHHERYDGKGYPEGKAGEDIPLIARMICVADSFDAMNSDRVYRRRLTRENVIEEIRTNRGTQFDPKLADVMLSLLESGKIVIEE